MLTDVLFEVNTAFYTEEQIWVTEVEVEEPRSFNSDLCIFPLYPK